MLKILMVASEATPYAKTGGLADVVGSLPVALRELGHEVAVLLPRYAHVDLKSSKRIYDPLPVWLGGTRYNTALYLAPGPVSFYLLDCPTLFHRAGYYGDGGADFPDNHIRFAVLSRAALTVVRHVFRPHILHCHDWQTGLAPVYIHTLFARDPSFMGIKTLFTIHNLGYQGLFSKSALAEIGLNASLFTPEALEFFGKISLIKGGLVYSDFLSTVSKTYAAEIQTPEYGFGLDGLLRKRRTVLWGILNGADYKRWDPKTDPHIAANYSAADLSGKQKCKKALVEEFGLSPTALSQPLIGIVSRFTSQKGADLIAEIGAELAAENLSLVALGTGDAVYEELLLALALENTGRIAVRIGFDEPLAHKIEAGADMFLMPSRYEPCGLNQVYSLRYGAVPIVRATGGLDDTIEEGTGFKFSEYSGPALLGAVRAACAAFADRNRWTDMMRRGMEKDFSWGAAAKEYSGLYQTLVNR